MPTLNLVTKITIDDLLFIVSKLSQAEFFQFELGGKWLILDIVFREDDCWVRQENAAENLVILRNISFNLLNQEKTTKADTHAKRLKAGWDEPYFLKILNY
jgi:predicted transposase YbfD/YdcC